MHKKQHGDSTCLGFLIPLPLPPPSSYSLVPSPASQGGARDGSHCHFFESFHSIPFIPHKSKPLRFPLILLIHQFMEHLIKLCGLSARTTGIKAFGNKRNRLVGVERMRGAGEVWQRAQLRPGAGMGGKWGTAGGRACVQLYTRGLSSPFFSRRVWSAHCLSDLWSSIGLGHMLTGWRKEPLHRPALPSSSNSSNKSSAQDTPSSSYLEPLVA